LAPTVIIVLTIERVISFPMRRSASDDDPFDWNPCWSWDPDVDSDDDFNPTRSQITIAVPQPLQPPVIPILADSGKDQVKMTQKVTKTGSGREAARAAMFQMHNVDSSRVVNEWKKTLEGTTITKRLLMTLIKSILDFCPVYQRPSPPTRNMKRMKQGLIFWLDTDEVVALHYLNGIRMNE
jgi:hypothetical protein